jgi:hypothetical protein
VVPIGTSGVKEIIVSFPKFGNKINTDNPAPACSTLLFRLSINPFPEYKEIYENL